MFRKKKYYMLKTSTLNCNFPKGRQWQAELISKFIREEKPDVLCLQELVFEPYVPGYHLVQGDLHSGKPAGEAILVKRDLKISSLGVAPAFTNRYGQSIKYRTMPWVTLELPIRSKRNALFILDEHRPPARMQFSPIDEENDKNARAMLRESTARFKMVCGDLNEPGTKDPVGLGWKYAPKRGIDLFNMNRALYRKYRPALNSSFNKVKRDDGHRGESITFRFEAKK